MKAELIEEHRQHHSRETSYYFLDGSIVNRAEFADEARAARERDEQERMKALGVEAGTCEGCYQSPCICLPDDYPCDPE